VASSYIEQAIITRLKSVTAITAIVGSGSSARIYYMDAPESPTYPYVLIQEISDADLNFNIGTDGASPRLQIDSVDKNEDLANIKPLDRAIRASLNDYSGTVDGIVINCIERGGSRSISEEPFIRLIRDFIIYYEVPA